MTINNTHRQTDRQTERLLNERNKRKRIDLNTEKREYIKTHTHVCTQYTFVYEIVFGCSAAVECGIGCVSIRYTLTLSVPSAFSFAPSHCVVPYPYAAICGSADVLVSMLLLALYLSRSSLALFSLDKLYQCMRLFIWPLLNIQKR